MAIYILSRWNFSGSNTSQSYLMSTCERLAILEVCFSWVARCEKQEKGVVSCFNNTIHCRWRIWDNGRLVTWPASIPAQVTCQRWRGCWCTDIISILKLAGLNDSYVHGVALMKFMKFKMTNWLEACWL